MAAYGGANKLADAFVGGIAALLAAEFAGAEVANILLSASSSSRWLVMLLVASLAVLLAGGAGLAAHTQQGVLGGAFVAGITTFIGALVVGAEIAKILLD